MSDIERTREAYISARFLSLSLINVHSEDDDDLHELNDGVIDIHLRFCDSPTESRKVCMYGAGAEHKARGVEYIIQEIQNAVVAFFRLCVHFTVLFSVRLVYQCKFLAVRLGGGMDHILAERYCFFAGQRVIHRHYARRLARVVAEPRADGRSAFYISRGIRAVKVAESAGERRCGAADSPFRLGGDVAHPRHENIAKRAFVDKRRGTTPASRPDCRRGR